MYAIEPVPSEPMVRCERCQAVAARRTMRRPHGCDWWCSHCLAEYDHYRRTHTWLARKLHMPPVNLGVAGLVLTVVLIATVGLGPIWPILLIYPALLLFIPLGAFSASSSRRRFLRDGQARLPIATVIPPSQSPHAGD